MNLPKWVLAAVLLLSSLPLPHAVAADSFQNLRRAPDAITVDTSTSAGIALHPDGNGKDVWRGGGVEVVTRVEPAGLAVELAAPGVAVKRLQLSWQAALPADWKYLGDAWERAYGDLEWLPLDAKRAMPWYFLASDGKLTHGYGVATGPAALCHWTAQASSINLHADVRCGGAGVALGARRLKVCTVVCRAGQPNETPFAAACAFCKQMCPAPRLPQAPVYGFNDWYCAYGRDTAEEFLKNAAYVISLAPKGGNRPFMVVDDGWQVPRDPSPPNGPGSWNRTNPRFSATLTMADLAGKIRALDARPGLWVRPLLASPDHPASWRLARDRKYLDPTVPEVRAYVRQTMARISGWGYDLIKHDYSTYDIVGRWGFEIKGEMIAGNWAFADRSRTTAEVILDLYKDIREASGDKTLIIGCNTVSHLAAGLFEMQRIGDDTSGKEWARTRKMGVNCMAFRAAQHGAFYANDGDCAGQVAAGSVPWEKNRQWLDLLGRSGTPLFVSFPRSSISPEQEPALRAALTAASRPQPLGEPLDWLESRTPEKWKLDGENVNFTW